MSQLRMEVWAFPFDSDPVPLPDLKEWKTSPTDGDWGSIEFDYPTAGRNYAVLDVITADDVDLRVEITVSDANGVRWTKPGILLDHDGDDVVEGEIVKVTGVFHEYEFSEVVLPYAPGGENGETAVSGNAGQITGPLLTAAQGRGCLQGVTWTFTNTHDSAGVPWSHVGNLRLSPGMTYAAILGTLTGYGLSEWELSNTRELRLYDGENGKGVDRTVGPNPLTLEHGRDLEDAPRKRTLRSAINALITNGKDGLHSEAVDATARAKRRRRVEAFYSFGNAAEQGTLDALTAARLGTQTAGQLALSHNLVLGAGPTPLIDYQPSDWIYSAARRGPSRQRVKLITLQGSGDEVSSAAVALNSLTAERAVKNAAALEALTSGTATVGTSLPPPEVDDGTTPAVVDGNTVVANGLWYATTEGNGQASVTAAWTAPADATITGYVVEWRFTSASYGSTGWQTLPETTGTTLTWSGVAAGAAVEVRVRSANKWGRVSAPSSPVYAFTTPLNTTPPPILPAPVGSAYLGFLKWDWNGKGAAGESMPGNFRRAELHLSTTSGFTPHRPLLADGKTLDTAASTTYRDELTGAGELPVDPGGAYGVTWYAKWVPVDRAGLAGTASAQGSAVRVQAADGDIAEVNIGKLRTGILTALLTISGIIRTATAGARVELDTTGLRCISSTGAVLFEFNIPTSILTLVGKLITGQGVGVGATIVVDPGPPPRILLYPTATQQRYSLSAESTVRPDGTTAAGLQLSSLNASGQTDGFAIDAWSTNVQIGHRVTSGLFSGAMLVLERLGVARLLTAGGFLQVASSGQVNATNNNGDIQVAASGRIDFTAIAPNQPIVTNATGGVSINDDSGASIRIESDGDIRIDPATGKELTSSRPFGSGNGFSFMAQGGAGGGYRAYTGGGAYLAFVDNNANAIVQLGNASGAYKNFVIPHPVDPDRWLVHACTEAPEAQVEYRGVVELVGGRAVVELPDYFEAATRADGRTVHVSMVLDDDEEVQLHSVAAALPRRGRFRIASTAPDGARVAWLVKAVRADGPALDVEPLRSAVEVHGEGPYRTIHHREQEAA